MVKKNEMSFLEHLEELRWRLVKSALAVVLFAVPAGFFWKQIFDFVMIYPLRFAVPRPHLIYTSPVESVMLSIKIAIAGGLIGSAPVIFYQLWRFISPGLYKNEKKLVMPTVIASTFSFLAGITFCYLALPLVLRFLTAFAANRIDPFFKVNDYLSFVIKLSLAFGLVFEMPVVSFVLARIGILTPKFLLKNFRYAIVIIFIIAAILTPPDIFSQLLLAVPLMVLYGISILVAWLAGRRKAK
jgi:sec-independent protein translocase protein TatC